MSIYHVRFRVVRFISVMSKDVARLALALPNYECNSGERIHVDQYLPPQLAVAINTYRPKAWIAKHHMIVDSSWFPEQDFAKCGPSFWADLYRDRWRCCDIDALVYMMTYHTDYVRDPADCNSLLLYCLRSLMRGHRDDTKSHLSRMVKQAFHNIPLMLFLSNGMEREDGYAGSHFRGVVAHTITNEWDTNPVDFPREKYAFLGNYLRRSFAFDAVEIITASCITKHLFPQRWLDSEERTLRDMERFAQRFCQERAVQIIGTLKDALVAESLKIRAARICINKGTLRECDLHGMLGVSSALEFTKVLPLDLALICFRRVVTIFTPVVRRERRTYERRCRQLSMKDVVKTYRPYMAVCALYENVKRRGEVMEVTDAERDMVKNAVDHVSCVVRSWRRRAEEHGEMHLWMETSRLTSAMTDALSVLWLE